MKGYGCLLFPGIFGGILVGLLLGQPSIGVLVGLFVSVVLILALGWRDNQHGR